MDEWVPLWYERAKCFTRMTWLGRYEEVFELMQPIRGAKASKVINDAAGVQSDGSDDDDSDLNNDDTDDHSDDNSDSDSDDDSDEALTCKFVTLDGKVFPVQTSKVSHALKRACYSSKTGTAGLQTLVWAMPCGSPILVTGLFAAKFTEPRQVELHSGWLVAIPKDVSILEDRGFRRLQHCYPK